MVPLYTPLFFGWTISLNLKIIDAANLDRVAYWRKVHIYLPPLHRKQIQIRGVNNLLRFSYSWGHRERLCFIWRKRKYMEIKTTAKLNSKQTSIATVRDLYRMYATFPDTPWFSLQTTFTTLKTFMLLS
jgi:hypothetical protein